MHPPPKIEVLAGLKGSSIDIVSFGRFGLHLVFENGNRLSVSAPFRFGLDATIGESSVFEFPLSESPLVRILGHTITNVDCDFDGTLDLLFSNDDRLIVYANNPMYEAYTLLIEGQEYVV